MDAEAFGEFAGRVLAAFLAILALAALVLAFVVIAYFSAPSQRRHPPQGAPAAGAGPAVAPAATSGGAIRR